ncbi:hypothetical protein AUJ83_00160 [Candidatus Woesearchaeota archaeon CG1_02_33_12]|nr:MAG: hypothetical protein AUJ83_00160 [Candidatus Woesearchaeota archaeon CG1_02_33_12]
MAIGKIKEDSNMKISIGFQSSCSEAVFKFFTVKPGEVQIILGAIADTVNGHYESDDWRPDAIKDQEQTAKDQVIYKLGSSAEVKEFVNNTPFKELTIKKLLPFLKKVYGKVTKRNIDDIKISLDVKNNALATDSNSVPLFKNVSDYENVNILNCAGLGDNNSVINVNKSKGYFTLNIGNNDIGDSNWQDVVMGLGIYVEEAESSKELQSLSRDCTCGLTFFDGYDKLITDKNRVKKLKEMKKIRIKK